MTARGTLAAGAFVFAVCAAPAGEPRPAGGARTLTCEFSTVQTGQFRGLNYIGAPPESGIILTLVASGDDVGAGRAVMAALSIPGWASRYHALLPIGVGITI